jgi:Fe-S cluster assembly protein SufD
MPNRKDEKWKYTSLRSFIADSWDIPAVASKVALDQQLKTDCLHLVLVNGRIDATHTELGADLSLVEMSSLTEADQALVVKALEKTSNQSDVFASLNSSFLEEIVFLKVTAGKKVEKPLQIHSQLIGGDTKNLVFPRVFIVAEKSSEVAILETTSLDGQANATAFAPVVDVTLHDNAQVERVILSLPDAAFVFKASQVNVGRDACYRETILFSGQHIGRNDTRVDLNGAGCHASLHAVYLAAGKEHLDYQSEIHHNCEHATSAQMVKGVLRDRGRFVFNGKIYVHVGAKGTDSSQINANLLMGENTEVDTKPTLLIDNDDVKCSHGATVSRINDEQLFYLTSRGISRAFAENMLAKAFVEEVVYTVQNEVLKKYMDESLEVIWSR